MAWTLQELEEGIRGTISDNLKSEIGNVLGVDSEQVGGDELQEFLSDARVFKFATGFGIPREDYSSLSVRMEQIERFDYEAVCKFGASVGLSNELSSYFSTADGKTFKRLYETWTEQVSQDVNSAVDVIGGVVTAANTSEPENVSSSPDAVQRDFGAEFLEDEQEPEPEIVEPEVIATEPETYRNFTYTVDDEEDLHVRGRLTRIRANITAIRTLLTLEEEQRVADPEEMKALARYCGFGADKRLFDESEVNEHRARYNEEVAKLYKLRTELKEMISDEDYASLKVSILNAHFTPARVCASLWEMATSAGFEGGKVFCPGIGSARIEGILPESLQGKTVFHAVELDSLTSRIASKLMPDASIDNCSIEDNGFPNEQYDLAIGNVPFAQHKIEGLNLHNRCIAECLDKLRDGGIGVIITSASTLDNNTKERAVLRNKGMDLHFAVRLPNNAMKGTNTEVVTDILVFRKNLGLRREVGEDFVTPTTMELPNVGGYNTEGSTGMHSLNGVFVRHPEWTIGRHVLSFENNMYGRQESGQYTVLAPENFGEKEVFDALDALVATMPREIGYESDVVPQASTGKFLKQGKPGAYAFDDSGNLAVIQKSGNGYVFSYEFPWQRKEEPIKLPRGCRTHEQALEILGDYTRIKDAYFALIEHDSHSDDEARSDVMRSNLNEAYDGFVLKHGVIADSHQLRRLAIEDPDYALISTLETKHEKQTVKEVIFTERTIFSEPQRDITSLEDTVLVSLDRLGYVSLPYVSELAGRKVKESELIATGQVFKDPVSGELVDRITYLSGDVRQKLEDAKNASKSNSNFAVNVKALDAVQPEMVTIDGISVNMQATWMPEETIRGFLSSEGFNGNNVTIVRLPSGDVKIDGLYPTDYGTASKWRHSRFDAKKLITHALQGKPARVTETKTYYDDQGKERKRTIFLQKETSEANYLLEQFNKAFKSYVIDRTDETKRVEDAFNLQANKLVPAQYDGSYLTMPTMRKGEGALNPRPHQLDVTARMLREKSGIIAHSVGFGKTLAISMIAAELSRLKMAKRVVIACDHDSYPQFVQTVMKNFPTLNILYADEHNMSAKHRNGFLGRAMNGNYDVVMMTHSHMSLIPNSKETVKSFLEKEILSIEEALESANAQSVAEGGKSKAARTIAAKLVSEKAKIKNRIRELDKHKDNVVTWEDLGVDFLIVDEIHRFKRARFHTMHNNIKGLDKSTSQRGIDLCMKAFGIQTRRGDGTGVIGATGTPVSNTLAECWQMLRLTRPNTLKLYGIEHTDNFFKNYCLITSQVELNEANFRFREVSRFRKFTNGESLLRMIRTSWDVQMDSSKLDLKNIPDVKGGGPQVHVCPMTPALENLMDGISEIYDAYENVMKDSSATKDEKQEVAHIPIMLMQTGMAASIDPRLIDPSAEPHPDYPMTRAAKRIMEIYNETDGKLTQCVFSDKYRRMNTECLNDVFGGDWISGVSENGIVIKGVEDLDDDNPVSNDDDEFGPAEIYSEEEFNLYLHLKSELVEMGYPEDRIAIFGQCKNNTERNALYARCNSDHPNDVGMLVLGSTRKGGTGTNFQERLVAIHHLDAPSDMTHASLTQRNGRGIRQREKDLVKEIEINYYAVEGSSMPGIFDRLNTKGSFTKQLFTEDGAGVEFDDPCCVDIGDITAMLTPDKRVLKQQELKKQWQEMRLELEMQEKQYTQLRSDIAINERRLIPRDEEVAQAEAYVAKVAEMTKGLDGDDAEHVLSIKGLGPEKVVKGNRRELEKFIKPYLDDYKTNLPSHHNLDQTVACVRVNGLRVDIGYTMTFKSNRAVLGFRPICPVAQRPTNEFYRAATPESFFKCVEEARNNMLSQAAAVKSQYATTERTLESLRNRLEKLGKPEANTEAIERIEQELIELNADLVENPVQRKPRRSERWNSVTGNIANQAEANESPDIARTPVRMRI